MIGMKFKFEKSNYFNGILIALGIYGLLRIGLSFLVEYVNLNTQSISILIWAGIMVLFNRKWIYRVTIDGNRGIEFFYPIEIFHKRSDIIPFSKIEKIKYCGYAYNSPAHFKLKFNNNKYRFNCPEDESKKLIQLFKDKNIDVEYFDENKVGYR